jgi:16S rRNA (cytosine967-C5)-methyltransferase
MSARSIALAALREWRKKDRFADAIIHDLLANKSLQESDRGFALELFYGVLRNLTLLDFWIDQLRTGKLDTASRDLLRLGFYQLFVLRTAAHAAVNETVELARAKERGLINGVLRAAQRREEELRKKTNLQSLSVRFSHPNFLVERWEKTFGSNATALLCEWNNQPARIYARVNRLKIEVDDFLRMYPTVRPLPNPSEFVEFGPVLVDALEKGVCYIQDPSTAVACELLAAQPGETVLDACAAPGGKTALLAQQMRNRGSIVACDREPQRIDRLRENLERLGVENATVVMHDWMHVGKPTALRTEFDRILLDTPCSNTGVIRRRVDVRWRLGPDDFARMQQLQLAIIRNLVGLLKRNGVLVYSTCTLEPEENEQVIARISKEFPDLRLTEQTFVTPFRDGFDGAFAAKFIRIT